MSYSQKKEALYERYKTFMEKKEAKGMLKNLGSELANDELKSLLWNDEFGTSYEKHHMPASNSLPDSIPYEEGACVNVPKEIHSQTFTNGLNESNRAYDYGLYNSLTYEDMLEFDNKNLKDLYAKMKPGANQEEIARRLDENLEFSKNNKKNHEEQTQDNNSCPEK